MQSDALRQQILVLRIEQEFDEVLEPGAGHAIEIEWAIVKGKLYVLQARPIPSVP